MFKQVWNQVEHITALSNSTQVITYTDIVINNMQIIIPNKNASLHPIHLISQTKGVNITISNCLMKGLRLMFDNANISLYIENSTLTAAGISIQSEENTEHLPVHIQSCHFSGHFPEDTLLFNNTDNVSIESCHFTDLQFKKDESSVIKGINSSFHIDHSIFTNNTGSISIHGGSSQIISCSFTKSRSCLKVEDTTVNISLSKFDGNRDGCIHGHNAVLHIVDSSLTSNIAQQNGGTVNIYSSHVTLDNCLLINNTARWYNNVYEWWDGRVGRWQGDAGAVFAGNSHVTLGNCSLINNTASDHGGAVYAYDNSNVTLGNCSLINNTARWWGGAVSAWVNSQVTLGNCSLINNTVVGFGGAVTAVNSQVILGNCSLINNTAIGGGAVFAYNSCVTLGNCSLINNTASDEGGAVYTYDNSNVTLGNCSLINSTAMGGGAVFANNSCVTLGNCSLINNSAGEDGGAVSYSMVSVESDFKGSVLLTDSHLNSNRAGRDGGAIQVEYAQITMKRCSLSNNEAQQDGAAIKVHVQSVIHMTSVEFVNNTAGSGGGAMMVLDHSELQDTGSIYMQNLARGFGEYGSNFATLEG